MSLPRSVAEILREHVTLEVEGIDRMYLNTYVPGLQYESGVAAFFRRHRGHETSTSVKSVLQRLRHSLVRCIRRH